MTETWFTFPEIDPIAIQLGPLAIRWYALAYIAGILLAWRILAQQTKAATAPFTSKQLDQLLNYSLLGIMLGGRLGYVLFYDPVYFLANPADIFKIWQGGMSFHGGFIGTIMAIIYVCHSQKIPLAIFSDRVASVAPIGLFFGRLANYINGELFGRVTDHPIGIVFPAGGPLARHPSQLYEAALEGVLLGIIMFLLARRGAYSRPFYLTGIFACGYGLSRWLVEYVREPDAHIGVLVQFSGVGLTMGQLLSLPMIVIGAYLILRNRKPSTDV